MTVIKMAAGVTCLGGGELGDVAEVTLFHLPGGGGEGGHQSKEQSEGQQLLLSRKL